MKQWHHSPIHILNQSGTFMLTAATYQKQHFFNSEARLQLLHDNLLENAADMGWLLQAWAVFPNHYHFLAISPDNPESLKGLIKKIHGATSKLINAEDGSPGRKVWFQYWESQITYETSYCARLNYVHNNAVHHGIVDNALKYKWCSASWFEGTAEKSFRKAVNGFKTNTIKIHDDF